MAAAMRASPFSADSGCTELRFLSESDSRKGSNVQHYALKSWGKGDNHSQLQLHTRNRQPKLLSERKIINIKQEFLCFRSVLADRKSLTSKYFCIALRCSRQKWRDMHNTCSQMFSNVCKCKKTRLASGIVLQ